MDWSGPVSGAKWQECPRVSGFGYQLCRNSQQINRIRQIFDGLTIFLKRANQFFFNQLVIFVNVIAFHVMSFVRPPFRAANTPTVCCLSHWCNARLAGRASMTFLKLTGYPGLINNCRPVMWPRIVVYGFFDSVDQSGSSLIFGIEYDFHVVLGEEIRVVAMWKI